MSMANQLAQVMHVDDAACKNCHACISICPVKYCNDGSGEAVSVKQDLCIGCGECLEACTRQARMRKDDFEAFINANKNQMVAIVAPAVASNFPNDFLRLNGWLKSIGVKGIFDVSFGAELTVKTYLEHAKKANPKTIIAQPCPAIVTYIFMFVNSFFCCA